MFNFGEAFYIYPQVLIILFPENFILIWVFGLFTNIVYV